MPRSFRTAPRALGRALPLVALALTVAAAPPDEDVVNGALADASTSAGSVGPGDHTATVVSDDAVEVLTEEETSGKPTKRLSLLDHVWSFDLAPGHNYVFEVEAFHSPNTEGDHFYFSYSTDGATWLPLLTVTKTADDDAAQTHVFPVDMAGPLSVRVEDTDRTPGLREQDVLSVDRLVIVSDRTNPDTTPPPGGEELSAHSGDAVVELEWPAASSSDVDGYRLERAVGDGPYSVLTPSPVAGTSYVDTAVANMTLYRYRMRHVDAAGNTSPSTGEALAVPHEGGGPVFARVVSVNVNTQTVVAGFKQAVARVRVADEYGDPVEGALVTVAFGGMYHETLSATTGADGVAVIGTNQAEKGKVDAAGCVIDVSHPSMFHLPQLDAQACDG